MLLEDDAPRSVSPDSEDPELPLPIDVAVLPVVGSGGVPVLVPSSSVVLEPGVGVVDSAVIPELGNSPPVVPPASSSSDADALSPS